MAYYTRRPTEVHATEAVLQITIGFDLNAIDHEHP